MAVSPYKDKTEDKWQEITDKLVNDYPLTKEEVLDISIIAWDRLWNTEVGNTIKLNEVDLPASVIGYFFQKLYSHELENRYPKKWRGEHEKSDKDIVCIKNTKYSTEMKSSGQLAYKIFGNRSYCQSSDTPSKAKSGYYITVNFYQKRLTLISLGWIDKDDWNCQDAESGQAATLPQNVYDNKLIHINGSYQLMSPIRLLNGVGPGKEKELNKLSIFTFKDMIEKSNTNKIIEKIYTNNKQLLDLIKSYI